MNQILFLCTGNYYRSRYAEIVFNHLVSGSELPWTATSRGLAPDERNPGPISRHTLAALRTAGIPAPDPIRSPMALTRDDLMAATMIVAVKEAEHKPLLEQQFSDLLPRVEFWHVHDLDCAGPEDALPLLKNHLDELIDRLRLGHGMRQSSTTMSRSA